MLDKAKITRAMKTNDDTCNIMSCGILKTEQETVLSPPA